MSPKSPRSRRDSTEDPNGRGLLVLSGLSESFPALAYTERGANDGCEDEAMMCPWFLGLFVSRAGN